MQTKSQKYLKTLSIVVIVLAALTAIIGFIAMFTGGAVMWEGAELLNEGVADPNDEITMATGGGFIAFMMGGAMIFAGIIDIIIGILGLGVAKDGRRVKFYIGLAIFGLICSAVTFISSLVGGSFDFTVLISIAIVGAALYFALDIKKTVVDPQA